jgi:predicted N-acetyltransferase YhbS
MELQLRPIRRQDASEVAGLLGQLGYPTTEASVRERLDRWLDDRSSWLIGAEDDGELVGVAALHAMPLLEKPGRLGRLAALVVDERYRSRGLVRQPHFEILCRGVAGRGVRRGALRVGRPSHSSA